MEHRKADDHEVVPTNVARILKSLENLKPGTKPEQFYRELGIWDDKSVEEIGGGGSLGSYWDELDLGIDGEWALNVEHAVDRTGKFKETPTVPSGQPNTFVWEVRVLRGSIVAHKRGEKVDWKTIYPYYHKGKLVDAAVDRKGQTEPVGTGQPATSPVLKSEGSAKPQPEAEGRSR